MRTDPVHAIADAVLYEGYILWPYRRSAMKNAQRWTFGGVYPRAWNADDHPDDRSEVQTQVLVRGDPRVEVVVRFLHVVRRQVLCAGRPVDELTVGDERHLSWEEAVERELSPGPIEVPSGRHEDPLGDEGSILRSWKRLDGSVDVVTERLRRDLHRVTVHVSNTSPFDPGTREQALGQTFCSCHAVLRAAEGEFVSLTDPPPELREQAAACVNDGVWPVLVGDPSTTLASPIILEDYPRVAPESPGDLFDGGEIDQMLVLNILTLSDEEKDEMRATDPRAREILERTESLTPQQMMALNGRLTDLRYV